ncbi:MAG: HAMP domain-containing histidine kinase [Candidatus Aminicenantes bacterium]|nr:MAG: HAMP domain-containing histidine kinase [Candidatus Aminicenantes bacterium]
MRKFSFYLSLCTGFFIILISVYGYFLLLNRTGLPAEINTQNLRQIDNIKIEHEKDVEFILSNRTIDERSILLIQNDDGKIEKKEIFLIPFYSTPFPLIYLVIGLFIMVIGISVLFLKPDEARARIFYWAALLFASSIVINTGFCHLREGWLPCIPGIMFYILYPLAPALLLHFSLYFSRKRYRLEKFAIYFPALIFAGMLETLFLLSRIKTSIEIHRLYHVFYLYFRFYLILFVFLAILSLIIIYRKTILEEERSQIKWIFYGLFIGLGPFIFLYQLPQVMRLNPLISEELSQVFFILIPLAFAFSIVRFRLMNIELVINRSLVYTILTVFTVSLYLFSVSVLHNIFSKLFFVQETFIFMIGALGAAVVFHPARKKIQEFVDRTFFRQSYDYRRSILSFNDRAHRIVRRDHLVDFFLEKIKKTLPLEKMGIFIYFIDSGRLTLSIARDGEKDLGSLVSYGLASEKVITRKKAVKTEENIDFSQEAALKEKNLEIILPLSFRSTALAGYLTLGKKMSGERFTRDDLELLGTMAGELALNLERISLQEEVIFERAEKEKLDEVSRLKTEFISTVSHELRTPMSSIQGITEILQEQKVKDRAKRGELLDLMASETIRLSRLLHNILDFAKIEQNVKSYEYQKTEIEPLIEEAAKLFHHRLESEGFVLKIHFPDHPVYLEIDRDAVKQALDNLIDNAIKYSSDKKEIDIHLIEKDKQVEIQVEDKGVGIPREEQKRIFEGFYRSADASQLSTKGVGLGLKIIKHIMTVHKGDIKVESQPDKGSTFILVFPKP